MTWQEDEGILDCKNRNRGDNVKQWFVKFMQGRYGVDELTRVLVKGGLVVAILSVFVKNSLFSALCWAILFYAYFRMFSRNINKRYRENLKYLELKGKVLRFFRKGKNTAEQRKNFHIYTCPTCKQKIRIPKGKGKIEVRCPKCGTVFAKRS